MTWLEFLAAFPDFQLDAEESTELMRDGFVAVSPDGIAVYTVKLEVNKSEIDDMSKAFNEAR